MSARLVELPNGHWVAPATIAGIVVHPPSVMPTHRDDRRILAQLVVITYRGTHHICFFPALDEAKQAARDLALIVNAAPETEVCKEPTP
jgi:hypothetical protein